MSQNPPFYCKDCSCSFKRKLNYDYHLNTAKHKNRISKQNKPSFLCSICNKTFLHSSSLSRHKTNCKENPEKEEPVITNPRMDLAAEIQELHRMLEEIQRSRIEEIMKNENKVNVNCFGDEDLDYITHNDILDCMNNINVSIPLLLEKIHFDPEHPENNNVQIPNKKLPHARFVNSRSQWEYNYKNNTLHSMIENAYNILCDTFEEKQHELDVNTQQNFRDFQEIYRHKRTIRDIKNRVELLIIANRPIPVKI
jgi:hypothetical protein